MSLLLLAARPFFSSMSSLIVLTRNREMQRAEEIRATTAAGTVFQNRQKPEVGHPLLFGINRIL